MKKIFQRKEIKYLLNEDQKNEFLKYAKNYLVPDSYYDYCTQSIYMDTSSYELFRKSSEKPAYKEKVRIRWYERKVNQNSTLFLEIKKKFQGITYKRRINLNPIELRAYLKNPDSHKELSKEMAAVFRRYKLEPKVYLSYDRLAWTYPDNPEFRITLDSNLRYQILTSDCYGIKDPIKLNSNDKYILECKSDCNFPLEFIRLLSSLGIRQTSFSKIGYIYKDIILGGIKNGI